MGYHKSSKSSLHKKFMPLRDIFGNPFILKKVKAALDTVNASPIDSNNSTVKGKMDNYNSKANS
jgi:hypothetical protein